MAHPAYSCPVCHASLDDRSSIFACPNCHKEFPVQEGYPILIASELDAFKGEEQAFHDEISRTAPPRRIKGRNSSFHWHFLNPMRNLPAGSAVLEVACGTRADGIEIAERGIDVTSFDISPVSVAKSHGLAAQTPSISHMRFAVADAEHMPFADNSFDAAFIAASFHHLPHQEIALKEFARVVKPGGYIIWGIEPAQWPYRTVYRWLRPLKNFIRNNRNREHNSVADDTTEGYTEPMIREIFAKTNLELQEIRRIKYLGSLYEQVVRLYGRLRKRPTAVWLPLDHVLSFLDDGIRFIPLLNQLNWHYNVIARKPGGKS